jgi:hypothetical protein
MNNEFIKPDLCHEKAFETLKPLMAFDDSVDFKTYQADVRKKYLELLGDMPEKVPSNVQIEYTEDRGSFTETRFIFDTEEYAKRFLKIGSLNASKLPINTVNKLNVIQAYCTQVPVMKDGPAM